MKRERKRLSLRGRWERGPPGEPERLSLRGSVGAGTPRRAAEALLVLFGFGLEIVNHFSKQGHGEEAALLVLSDQPVGEECTWGRVPGPRAGAGWNGPSSPSGGRSLRRRLPSPSAWRPWHRRPDSTEGGGTQAVPDCLLTPGPAAGLPAPPRPVLPLAPPPLSPQAKAQWPVGHVSAGP